MMKPMNEASLRDLREEMMLSLTLGMTRHNLTTWIARIQLIVDRECESVTPPATNGPQLLEPLANEGRRTVVRTELHAAAERLREKAKDDRWLIAERHVTEAMIEVADALDPPR